MTHRIAKSSPQTWARIAGLLYIIVIVAGGWAQLFVRSHLIARNDVKMTAANILAQEPLFRGAVVADLIGVICYIAVVLILFKLLEPANRTLSLLAATFGMVGNAIFAINLLNHVAATVVLDNTNVLAAFNTTQSQSLALLFLKLHVQGYVVVMAFFGVYLTLLGVIIFGSTFLPRILGLLLVLGGLGDVTNSIVILLSLSSPLTVKLASYAFQLGGIAEIALALWLFVMGMSAAKWQRRWG